MLITFSGLDGSGKSTLIEWLRRRLEGEDRPVSVFHMYYDVGVYACARLVLGRLTNSDLFKRHEKRTKLNEDAKRGEEVARVSSPRSRTREAALRLRRAVVWNKALRMWVFPVDLLIFLCCRLYVEKVRGRVLIMDRYFYDTLADLSDGGPAYGVRLLSRLTPTPHVPVYIDISPEEAFARKGEHSVAYLKRRRAAYRKIFSGGRPVVIASERDPRSTRAALEKAVLERMCAR